MQSEKQQFEKPQFHRQVPPAKPAQQFHKQVPPAKPAQQFHKQVPPTKPAQQFQQPPVVKPISPKPAVELKKDGVKRLPPPSKELPPPSFQKRSAPVAKPPSGPAGPATVTPRFAPQGPALKQIDKVERRRVQRFENGGRKVFEAPGKRFIVKEHNRIIIRKNEAARFLRRPGAKSVRRKDGTVETFYVRPDGVRIVTVVDANGRLLRRYRHYRDGRERNIIDNRRFYRRFVGLGIGIIALNLALPRVTIPYDEYIVDYDDASDDDLYEALDAPPIEDLDRAYSLDEIRDNYELRARMRSIDLDSIIFESGSAEIPPDQYYKLERMARAILRVLRDNSEAVISVEGYTDAVGPEDQNLELSDDRATAVAEVLTNEFGVPEENLVTQGYGEQYLKIDTQEPEPRNRRVTIRNITRLMSER